MTWQGRTKPGDNCMQIIQTGLYDDTKLWEDTKIWWDNGEIGETWQGRIIP